MQSQRATLRAAKSAPARTNGGRADQVHPLIRGQRLETPEEIAQWIAERKRRYPTDANIRRKLAEEQGIAESEAKRRCLAPDAAGTNPLSTMLGAYGQSSDSDCNSDGSDGDSEDSDSPPETVPLKHYAPQTPHRPATMAPGGDRRALRVCRFYAKGSCTKGAACPFSHPQQGARQAPATAGPPPAPKHSSLLHMLLAKDIERENHRVLQCIQYICSNAFLGTQPRYD
ncbi:hypothetical protein GGI07_005803 [Coemansia sp. Benny D115]|nr:hypothetical protein GGI07_005803 [Coemansia sp. Benny D115]